MTYEKDIKRATKLAEDIITYDPIYGTGAYKGIYVDEPPDISDISMWIKSRTGLTFTDEYGNDVTILVPSFLRDEGTTSSIKGDKTRDSEKVFDGNNYTIYFQFRQVKDVNPTGTNDMVSFGGGGLAARRGIELKAYFNTLVIYIADGTTRYTQNLVPLVNTNLKDQGIFNVIITIDGTNNVATCGVYDSLNNLIGSAMNQDISLFTFNNNNNYEAFIFDSEKFVVENMKKFDSIKTLSQCQQDSYRTDMQMHLPNVFSGADISGDAQDFSHSSVTIDDIYYTNITPWLLEYGYDAYQYGLDPDYIRLIARDTQGVKYIPSRDAGAIWIGSRIVFESSGSNRMNLRDCKLRFTNAFMDRSNTTIWKNAARTGYYDTSNTKDFHISELNQKTIYDWLNDGYKGRLYVDFANNSVQNWERGILRQVFLYTTDRLGWDNIDVLSYTGDIICMVTSGKKGILDSYGYAKLGTLKTDRPMLTIRIDDGYDDIPTDWKPFFNNYNIPCIVGIHAALVGTNDTYNFATWQQITEMNVQKENYEIACHNNYDIDYSSLEYCDSIELDMRNGKTTQDAHNIICRHYIGNRHSSSNPSVQYFAHKVGFATHMAWGTYGKEGINGTNPQDLDLYRLCCMACDLGGDYNLNDTDNIQEIQNVKDQLDQAISDNAWAILFVHDYKVKVATALAEIFDYAESIGLEFYSINQALQNCRYL